MYAYGDSGEEFKLLDPTPDLKAMYEAERKSKAAHYSIPYSTEVAKGLMVLKWKFTREQAMDVFKYVENEADRRGGADLTTQERECCCFACKKLDNEHESVCLAHYFDMVDAGYPYCDCKRSLSLLECEQSLLLLNRALACAPEDAETLYKLSRRYHRLHYIHRETGRTQAAAERLSGNHLRDLTGYPTDVSGSDAMEQYFTLQLG